MKDRDGINIRNIEERQAFQVGARLYRTIHAAAKGEAWRMILGRYGELKDARPHGMVCDCGYSENGYGRYWDATCCEIHARKSGYFARLHKRLKRAILKTWTSPTY